MREYLVKGFTLDDERLKQGGIKYFDELLARIRDVRASEKNFYEKIRDIYATSAYYDERARTFSRWPKTNCIGRFTGIQRLN